MAVVLIVASVVVADNPAFVPRDTDPVPVEALTREPRSIDLVRTVIGVAEARNTATITPQVSGKLIDLPLREGMLVSHNAVTKQQEDTQCALVGQLEAQNRGHQASIDSPRIQLDYATIRAPFAGIVGIGSIVVGNVAGRTVFRTGNISALATSRAAV